jgi:arylsulfatase A-like enzyme
MNMPNEFVAPEYRDGSIANVPSTVAALMDVPFAGLPPLREEVWRPLGGGVRRVVTIVIDALGWNLVEREKATFEPLLAQATAVSQLTSIFPSTTVAALSSLWTGAAPIQHGLVGLRLHMPEYGGIGQFLDFLPSVGMLPEALLAAGLDPQHFLRWPGMAEQLAAAGVESHALRGWEITDSMLSHMHGRGAVEHGATDFADMMAQTRDLLEQKAGEPLYVAAYWPSIDTLSHFYGWSSDVVAAEMSTLAEQIERDLLAALSPAARKDTAVLILADHGQIIATPQGQHYLEDYPELRSLLAMPATGEPRVTYLHAREGARDDLVAGLNDALGEALVAWTAEEALAAGLFGPPPFLAEGVQRLGDVIVAMRGEHVLFSDREGEKMMADRMIGRHGGMTQAEMKVPLLGFRLG